nr:MAG TPA: hypothetical protein [Caudoviricetes sp.]
MYSKTSPFSLPRKAGEAVSRGNVLWSRKPMLKGGGRFDSLTPTNK